MTSAKYARKAAWIVPTEAQEMCVLAQWLDMAGVLYCHVPNEGKRSFAVAARLKAEGMRRGIPDILAFTPPPNHPEYRGVAIELKRIKGGKISDEQRQWIADLAKAGWCTRIALGAGDAIGFLMTLGFGVGAGKST
jgi:hypothetical protein